MENPLFEFDDSEEPQFDTCCSQEVAALREEHNADCKSALDRDMVSSTARENSVSGAALWQLISLDTPPIMGTEKQGIADSWEGG